jgi:hypothetical protein
MLMSTQVDQRNTLIMTNWMLLGGMVAFYIYLALVLTSNHSDQDDYEIVRKVGRGKYSEVFEGVHVESNEVSFHQLTISSPSPSLDFSRNV